MRYIVGLLLGIGLVVLTFILIFKAFSGNKGNQPQVIDLNSYATTNAVVRYTVDGQINANQIHQRVRVTVSSDQILYEQLQGYQGQVVKTQTYASNPEAFNAFLHALSQAGFVKGKTDAPKDERGYCPLGRRYIYETLTGGENITRWWSDSCSTAEGNFAGKPSTIRQLFINQVPDYNKLTNNVRL
jgi:hypothetical protein